MLQFACVMLACQADMLLLPVSVDSLLLFGTEGF